MSEIVEFDIIHEYSLYKVGIVVEVSLRSGDVDFVVEARVDTGSTYSVFRRHLGEALGFMIESGIRVDIGTATGSFRAYGHMLDLSVLGMDMQTTIYFAESDLFDRNVLGRIGWLDRVKLGLIEPEGKLYLSQYRS